MTKVDSYFWPKILLFSAFPLLGCGGEEPPPDIQPDVPVWYGEVDAVVIQSCAGCHNDESIGGFGLTNYQEAANWADAMASSVAAGNMPPWHADPECNDYQDVLALADEQIATIVEWADAGAPEGDAADASEVSPPPESTLSRVDAVLEMPEPYEPQLHPDDYRCFPLDWSVDSGYATGFRVVPGNHRIVHHVIAYRVSGEDREQVEALEQAEDGPGYTCFGGPGVGDGADWLAAWAPGEVGGDFPETTGIHVEDDDIVVLQVHYNVDHTDSEGETDQSKIEFRVDDDVERPAMIVPVLEFSWLGGGEMVIPANTTGVTHEGGFTIPAGWGGLIWTANLHMHNLGRTATLHIDRADGSSECALHIPDWDFHWQRTYALQEPIEVHPGDSLRVSCTWDNPTDQDVDWGEGTDDEMCLGTLYMSLP